MLHREAEVDLLEKGHMSLMEVHHVTLSKRVPVKAAERCQGIEDDWEFLRGPV